MHFMQVKKRINLARVDQVKDKRGAEGLLQRSLLLVGMKRLELSKQMKRRPKWGVHCYVYVDTKQGFFEFLSLQFVRRVNWWHKSCTSWWRAVHIRCRQYTFPGPCVIQSALSRAQLEGQDCFKTNQATPCAAKNFLPGILEIRDHQAGLKIKKYVGTDIDTHTLS